MLLLHEGAAVQRLRLVGDSEHALPLRHDLAAEKRPRLERPPAGVRRQHVQHGIAEVVDFMTQARNPFALGRHVDDGDVLLQCFIGSCMGILQLRPVLVCIRPIRVEQRIAHVHGSHQDLASNRSQEVLRSNVALADRRGAGLEIGQSPGEVVAGEEPGRADQRESHEQRRFDRRPRQHRNPAHNRRSR